MGEMDANTPESMGKCIQNMHTKGKYAQQNVCNFVEEEKNSKLHNLI